MKTMEPPQPSNDKSEKRLEGLMRHKQNVIDAAELLGQRLIEKGEFDFARQLIAKCYAHDCSKFHGIEWDALHRDVDEEERHKAWKQHVETNDHHPEFWGDINEMPRLCVAEMVVDWSSRSHEMGTGLRDWVKDEALTKYNIKVNSKKHKEIMYFVNLLLDPEFVSQSQDKKKRTRKGNKNVQSKSGGEEV